MKILTTILTMLLYTFAAVDNKEAGIYIGRMNMYQISWQSKITGFESHGEPIFTETEARRQANQLNREFPEINHWAEHKQ